MTHNYEKARGIVDKLKAARLGDKTPAERDAVIIEAFAGDAEAFRLIDTQSGRFDVYRCPPEQEWFCYLRQLRNNPKRGRALFDTFK